MKLAISLLAVSAISANDTPLVSVHCWPGNENAPLCGCKLTSQDFNMVNSLCTANFTSDAKVHMMSVASSFPIPELSDSLNNFYAWTGYNYVSMLNRLDIVYFFEHESCLDYSADPPKFLNSIDGPDWIPDITCEPLEDAEYPSPRLGNFNYDIARSVQTYNVPIYGLEQGQMVEVTINAASNGVINGLELMNMTAHDGHGDTAANDCSNEGNFLFEQDADHHGLLEYVSFRLCDANCWTNYTTDYCFDIPSVWDSFVTV